MPVVVASAPASTSNICGFPGPADADVPDSRPTAAEPLPSAPLVSCGLRRRLASSLYELLPVVALIILVGGTFVGIAHLAGQAGDRLDRAARMALFASCYVAVGVYFVWCWRAGQTLPMKAWRLRVVMAEGVAGGPGWRPYLTRFGLASTAWGLAAGALLWLREHPDSALAWAAVAPLIAALAWRFVDRDGQALYDRLAGTRLVVEPRATRG